MWWRFGVCTVLSLGCGAGDPVGSTGDSGAWVEQYNTYPTCAITSPSDGRSVSVGDDLTFEARVMDAQDGDAELVVVWSSDLDGVLDVDGAPVDTWSRVSTDALTEGEHLIEVTATDSEGLTTADTVRISVVAASDDPTLVVLHPTVRDVAVAGEPFRLEVIVSDAQDAPGALRVDFSSGARGQHCMGVVPDALGAAVCDASFDAGEVELEVVVTDSDGRTTSAIALLLVAAG